MERERKRRLSCTDCGLYNCRNRGEQYPEFCLTTGCVEAGETAELDRFMAATP